MDVKSHKLYVLEFYIIYFWCCNIEEAYAIVSVYGK